MLNNAPYIHLYRPRVLCVFCHAPHRWVKGISLTATSTWKGGFGGVWVILDTGTFRLSSSSRGPWTITSLGFTGMSLKMTLPDSPASRVRAVEVDQARRKARLDADNKKEGAKTTGNAAGKAGKGGLKIDIEKVSEEERRAEESMRGMLCMIVLHKVTIDDRQVLTCMHAYCTVPLHVFTVIHHNVTIDDRQVLTPTQTSFVDAV